MEIHKSVSSVVETKRNRPVLFIFSVILLVALVAYALYLSFAKSAIQQQQGQLDADIASTNTQIAQLQSQNLEGQQYAAQFLTGLQKNEISWSEVIKTLQDLLPVDPLTQKAKIEFLSYSGSTDGKLTMNAQTVPGSADAFADVSNLLNTFNNSAYFQDAYIPSINHGLTDSGQDILTFVFNVTYAEQLPQVSALTNSAGSGSTQQQTGSASAVPVKVPRI
jgi:Tfp pilus assembly protein PilN